MSGEKICPDPAFRQFSNKAYMQAFKKQFHDDYKCSPWGNSPVAGIRPSGVVKTTVFLADMNGFAAINAICYAKYFPGKAPACVQAAALPKGALFEIEAIAVIVRYLQKQKIFFTIPAESSPCN